jgi:hypothetical protein
MADTYEGDPGNFTLPLTTALQAEVPEDGDALTAGSMRASVEFLMDFAEHIRQWTSDAQYNTEIGIYYNPNLEANPADWLYEAGLPPKPLQVSENAAACIDLPLPNGITVTAVKLELKGSAGHGGAIGNAPTLAVYKYDCGAGTNTQIGSTATDTTASVPANYEARHEISIPLGGSFVAARNQYRYYVAVTGEGGANWQAGLRINYLKIQMTPTSIDPRS